MNDNDHWALFFLSIMWLILWFDVLVTERKAKKRAEAIEKRLAALEANSTEEARYMAGTWLA